MIRDISPPVSEQLEVWPGDTPFSHRRVMELGGGDTCNVTTINTTVHCGAHVDAPLHFHADGADAASVDLDAYIGRARVVRVETAGAVTRADLEAHDLDGVERVLVHARTQSGPPRFAEATAHFHPEAAELAGERGWRLLGIDSFSVDAQDSKDLASHHALLRHEVRILEGLDLTDVPEGDYELIALPLKMVGVDASPVRAILRDL
ncbi:MAG: arylformamidase [Acidobacteriota bacterium]